MGYHVDMYEHVADCFEPKGIWVWLKNKPPGYGF